jgi:hypothetical protein
MYANLSRAPLDKATRGLLFPSSSSSPIGELGYMYSCRAPGSSFLYTSTTRVAAVNSDTDISKYGIWSGNPGVQLQCSSVLGITIS